MGSHQVMCRHLCPSLGREYQDTRSPGSSPSRAYLENGVVSVLAGAVPCSMAPRDIEEFSFPIDPLKPWILTAVHLGHQPGLQPHTAGWRGSPRGRLVHGKGLCRRKEGITQQIHSETLPCPWQKGLEVSTVSPSIQVFRVKCPFQLSTFLSQSHPMSAL